MKRLLALCLAGLMCLSLVACGGGEGERLLQDYAQKVQELEEQLRQQESTIADLTQRLAKYETPTEEPTPDEPAPTVPDPDPIVPAAPVYEEITLTAENWDNYFEIVFCPTFIPNAFGETYRLAFYYYFKLKDAYYPRLNEDATTILLESQYQYGTRECSVDFDAETYVLGDWTSQAFPMEGKKIVNRLNKVDGMYYTGSIIGGAGLLDKDTNGGVIMVYEDIEILRIQGTLTLLSE